MPLLDQTGQVRFLTRWETDRNHRFRRVEYDGDVIRDDRGRGVIFGYSPIGHTRWELANGDRNEPLWANHVADLVNQRPFRNFSYLVRIRSGRSVLSWTSGYPMIANGEFLGYRGTGRFTQVEPWPTRATG
jgi:hypothetical protein